jgi:preprotein translocase subunit Sec61beta
VIAEQLTGGQWWIVALAVSALVPVAFFFCLRSTKGAVLSLLVPAIGAFSVVGLSTGQGGGEREALVIHSVSMLALALTVTALRPEVVRYAELTRRGEEYEAPKWKINLYAVLTLAFAIGLMVLLLA